MTYEHQMMIMYATKLTVACSMMESIDARDMPDDVKEQARETYRMLNNLRRKVWGLIDSNETGQDIKLSREPIPAECGHESKEGSE